MHRISRIYVGNYGYKSCWYDGMLLNFIDEQRGEPTDYIIQLENGGGKSTLLAGIFSCFETSQNRFLKHLQENRNRFSEYFSPDGLPGFIIVEWMIPTPGPQEFRRIITGQVVALKSRITNELERVFFSFETAPDLALESIPAPKLNGEPALSMEDFTRWLSRVKREYKGNLFDTRNQNEWEQHLQEERGIDIGMLKLQVEFSRMEGSIDTAFLNFRNETEFLQKFLSLTMDTEQAAAVRNSVVTACDKLKRKPEFEKRLSVLAELHGRLTVFEADASELMAAKQRLYKGELHAAHVASTFLAASRDLAAEANECAALSQELTASVEELRQQQSVLTMSLNSATFVSLKRKAERARASHDASKAALSAAEEEMRYIRAAKSLAAILALRSQHEETRAMTALAEEGLIPFVEQARIQGKILKELLSRHKAVAEQDAANATEAARQMRREREELRQRAADLSKAISAKDRQLVQLKSEHQRYESACRRWLREGVLEFEGQLLSDAAARMRERLASHQKSLSDAEVAENTCDQSIKEISSQISEIKEQKATREEAVRNLERVLADVESLRDSLAQDRALCRAADSEVVDPDAEPLLALVDRYISELKRTRDACAVSLADLNRDRTEIETTGLAASIPDVQTILSVLSERGVRTACAFNSYIAQTEMDPAKARKLVLSNPARFLGVAVKTEKELEDARKILATPPALSKPVVVSLIANDPGTLVEGFVVAPESDAAYNFSCAKEYSAQVAARLDQQIRAGTEYEAMHVAAVEGRSRLLSYRQQYGNGRLNSLRRDLAAAEGEICELRLLLSVKGEDLQQKGAERERLRIRIKEEAQAIKDLSETIKLVDRDCDELEKPLPERLLQIATLEQELLKLEEQRVDAEEAAESAYQAFMREEAAAADHKRHTLELQRELVGIRHCDDQFDADASLSQRPIPLESARELYHNAAGTLDYEERTRLGVLKAKLEGIEKSLSDKEQEHVGDFGDLEEGRVLSCTTLDLVAQMSHWQRRHQEISLELDSAKANLAIADNELKKFKGKHPDAEQGSAAFSELSDEDLLVRLQSFPADIQNLSNEIEQHEAGISELAEKARSKRSLSDQFEDLAERLRQAIDLSEEFDPDPSLIPADPADRKALVAQLVREHKEAKNRLGEIGKKAGEAFRHLQAAMLGNELVEAEPEVAMLMANHGFESACESAGALRAAVGDRMAVAQNWLDSVKADFDATVEELLNLINEGIRIMSQACNKRLPEKAPYLGGKPVIKMKANLHGIPVEQRRRVLADFMDSIISSGMPHKTGTDMVADAVQRVAGRSLGLSLAKLTRDESEQYAPADKLSNSGGEAVSMALFLYILTAQIRAEMQADMRRQPGGPLLLDNPFAKASSPFIWRAQRAFARAMGVQLIFATATKDLETLGEFEHFIYLRRAGANSKTGRQHIEQSDLALRRT